jgi:hypothetical protein
MIADEKIINIDIKSHRKSQSYCDLRRNSMGDIDPNLADRTPAKKHKKIKRKLTKLKNLLENRLKMLIVSRKSHEYLYSFYNKVYIFITVLLVVSASGSFIVDFLYEDKHQSSTTKGLYLFFEVISLILIGILTKTQITEKLHGHHKSLEMVEELIQDIEFFMAKDINSKKAYGENLELYQEKIKSYKNNETYVPVWIKKKYIDT